MASRSTRVLKRKNKYSKRRTMKKQVGGAPAALAATVAAATIWAPLAARALGYGAPTVFTENNTYIYIGHGLDLDYELPRERRLKVPSNCVYVNSQICGLSNDARHDTILKQFATNNVFLDPEHNKTTINTILNTQVCSNSPTDAASECKWRRYPHWYSIGVYNAYEPYTDNLFEPFPIFPFNHKIFIMWGLEWGGLMSMTQIKARLAKVPAPREIKFDELVERQNEEFPIPGFYKSINFAKLRNFYKDFTYPSSVEFDNFKQKYSGKKYTVQDPSSRYSYDRIDKTFPDLNANEDIELDKNQFEQYKDFFHTKASDLMKKYPGIHYNLNCRPSGDENYRSAASHAARIAIHRANSLPQHSYAVTITTSFYLDTLENFKATWDLLYNKLSYDNLLDELGISRNHPALQSGKYTQEKDPQKRLAIRLKIITDWLQEKGPTNARGDRNSSKALHRCEKIAHITQTFVKDIA
jgi:hypothetical protein